MPHEVEILSETEVEIRLQIPGAELDAAVRKELKELNSQVRVPGFRPGKIPTKILVKKYGAVVQTEARRRLVEDALRAALNEHSLQPIKGPELDVEKMIATADGSLQTTLRLEVLPKIELRKYKGMEYQVPVVQIADEDVQRELEELRQQSGQPEEIDGAAEEGDFIQADVEYRLLDGSSLPVENDVWIDTRSGAIAGIPCEAAVGKFLGAEVGAEIEVSVELAPPFADAKQHGKTAVAVCTVKAIQRLSVPELDDQEFLDRLGVENVTDLGQRLRQRMESQGENRRNSQIEGMLLEQLVEVHPFPIPPSYLEESCEKERSKVRDDLRNRGTAPEEIETHLLEIEGRLLEGTEHRVRTQIILDRIVALEDLKLEEEDLQRHFVAMAQVMGMPPQQLYDTMQENGSLPGVMAQILRDKGRRFLREQGVSADQKEQEVSSGTAQGSDASSEQENS